MPLQGGSLECKLHRREAVRAGYRSAVSRSSSAVLSLGLLRLREAVRSLLREDAAPCILRAKSRAGLGRPWGAVLEWDVLAWAQYLSRLRHLLRARVREERVRGPIAGLASVMFRECRKGP